MQMQSAMQKEFLVKATSHYHKTLDGSPAGAYLEKRMLHLDTARFRLGYVDEPLPGHEMYRGMLAIPYLRLGYREWTAVAMRFRCVTPNCDHAGHHKYETVAGDKTRLYNTATLLAGSDHAAVCEGELDTISAELSGFHAIGVPGAEAWKPHFYEPLRGYEKVFVFSDGDDAGRNLSKKLAAELGNVVVVPSPPGEDVNSLLVKHGREFLQKQVYGRL